MTWHITMAIVMPEMFILPLDEATWQMMRALCTQMTHRAQSKRRFTLCFNLKLLTSKHFREWQCFILSIMNFYQIKFIWDVFFRIKIEVEGCCKESQTSSGNYLFCWNNIISQKSGKFTIFRRHRFFSCSLSTKKWDTNSFPREPEGFVVCFVFKGRCIFSPIGIKRTSSDLNKNAFQKMSRGKFLQSQPLQELVTASDLKQVL